MIHGIPDLVAFPRQRRFARNGVTTASLTRPQFAIGVVLGAAPGPIHLHDLADMIWPAEWPDHFHSIVLHRVVALRTALRPLHLGVRARHGRGFEMIDLTCAAPPRSYQP